MSFLSKLCGCFAPAGRSPHRASCPYEYPIQDGYPRGSGNNHHHDDLEGNVYSPTMPLPRYTPHPTMMNEKTLAFERPARSSWTSMSESRNQTYNGISADEKNPNDFRNSSEEPRNNNNNSQNADDQGSDASSTLSYPSSYGNTSTATTSPPPPYSPHPSPPPAGSILSLQMQMHGTGASRYSQDQQHQPPSPTSPVIHIPQPQPVLQRAQFLHQVPDGRERRRSEERRRNSNSGSLPPIYHGRDGM